MEQYVFLSLIGTGIAYLLYWIFLRRENSFDFNRFYLLGSLMLMLAAPVLNFPGPVRLHQISQVELKQSVFPTGLIESDVHGGEQILVSNPKDNYVAWLWSLYILITIVMLYRFFRNLRQVVLKIRSNDWYEFHGIRVIPLSEKGRSFSCFGYCFMNLKDLGNAAHANPVFRHEAAHLRQKHSVDVLVYEILACLFWFNPFVWLYKRAAMLNHEYAADQAAVQGGIDLRAYSECLITAGNPYDTMPLSNGFSLILIKKRLNMLHKSASKRVVKVARMTSVLTLLSLSFLITSFTGGTKSDTFTVVVDAGHGGKDHGSFNEKEVNLKVAHYLRELSKGTSIKIVLVRDQDEFITLKERSSFSNSQKADLLLSLHCNSATDPQARGANIYYSPKSPAAEVSLQSSQILARRLLDLCESTSINAANFMILRESEVPGVTVHMGFLSNEIDNNNLQSDLYQKSMAVALLEGLREIHQDR